VLGLVAPLRPAAAMNGRWIARQTTHISSGVASHGVTGTRVRAWVGDQERSAEVEMLVLGLRSGPVLVVAALPQLADG